MSGGGGGGNKEYVEEQYQYDVEKFKYDYQDMVDADAFNQKNFDIKIQNQADQINFQNKTRAQEWQHKKNMAVFDFNNKNEAYAASVKNFEQQLDLNDMAAEISTNDNTRKYNEQLMDIGFQNEDLLMKLDQTKDISGLKRRGVALALHDAKSDANLQQRSAVLALKGKRAEISAKMKQARLEGMQKKGAARNLGQVGRSARKNMQVVMANQADAQAALTDLLVREESSYNLNLQKVSNALSSAEAQGSLSYDEIATNVLHQVNQTKFGQQQLTESMKSAAGQYAADNQAISMQKFQADIQAQSMLAPKPKMAPLPPKPVHLPTPQMQRPPGPPTWERYKELHPVKGAITKGPSGLTQALGVASGIASIAAPFMMPSDDRLKRTYNRIGTSPSGVPIYTYKYIHDGEHGPWYKGTSAQDLLEMGRSDAVVQQEKDGFYYVDYSKLDVEFEKVTAT